MTADWSRLPLEVLEKISVRIVNDFPGHWRRDLLPAFEADSSAAPSPPETRVHDFHAELVAGRVQQQMVSRRFDMNFERSPIEKNGIHSR